jgi:uncharacterized membrane protein YedE/YeeE
MENFTPVPAALGGALIGLSAALLWITTGRIAGISGIVGGLATRSRSEIGWRVAFLAGLVAAPLIVIAVVGAPSVTVQAGRGTLIVAGLLVGFGTRLGGGCTSGHGVCGIARLSLRSIVATALFMLAAAITVFVSHHILGR